MRRSSAAQGGGRVIKAEKAPAILRGAFFVVGGGASGLVQIFDSLKACINEGIRRLIRFKAGVRTAHGNTTATEGGKDLLVGHVADRLDRVEGGWCVGHGAVG